MASNSSVTNCKQKGNCKDWTNPEKWSVICTELFLWMILKDCLDKNTEISSNDQALDSRIEILNIFKLQIEGGYHQRTHREDFDILLTVHLSTCARDGHL